MNFKPGFSKNIQSIIPADIEKTAEMKKEAFRIGDFVKTLAKDPLDIAGKAFKGTGGSAALGAGIGGVGGFLFPGNTAYVNADGSVSEYSPSFADRISSGLSSGVLGAGLGSFLHGGKNLYDMFKTPVGKKVTNSAVRGQM